jgi:hypothetical protein
MLAKVFSAGLVGIDAYPIEIEVDVSWGLPKEVVVGLPDAAVKESKDRVRAALCNSGYSYPGDKVTVNLAASGYQGYPMRRSGGVRGKGSAFPRGVTGTLNKVKRPARGALSPMGVSAS